MGFLTLHFFHSFFKCREYFHLCYFTIRRLRSFLSINHRHDVFPPCIKVDFLHSNELFLELLNALLALLPFTLTLPLAQALNEILKNFLSVAFVDRAEPWLPLKFFTDLVVSTEVGQLSSLLL